MLVVVEVVLPMEMLDKIGDALDHVARRALVYVLLKHIGNLFKAVVLVHVCQSHEAVAVRSSFLLEFSCKRSCYG